MTDAVRALGIARSLQGDKSYSSLTGQSLLLRARVHDQRGQRAEARAAAGEAVPQLTEALGGSHPDTLRAEQVARPVAGVLEGVRQPAGSGAPTGPG